MTLRDDKSEARDFLGPDRLRERNARDFQRIRNVLRHAGENFAHLDPAFARKLPLVARGADDAGERWWYFHGGVADVRIAEPLARQLRQFVEEYARDESRFLADFATAFRRLTWLGNDVTESSAERAPATSGTFSGLNFWPGRKPIFASFWRSVAFA